MIRIAEIVPVGHACRSRRKPGVYRDPEKRRRYHAALCVAAAPNVEPSGSMTPACAPRSSKPRLTTLWRSPRRHNSRFRYPTVTLTATLGRYASISGGLCRSSI